MSFWYSVTVLPTPPPSHLAALLDRLSLHRGCEFVVRVTGQKPRWTLGPRRTLGPRCSLGPLRSGYTSLKLPDRALHHHIETVTAEAGFAAEHPHSLPGFKQPRGEGVANVNSRGIPSPPLLQVFFLCSFILLAMCRFEGVLQRPRVMKQIWEDTAAA